MAELGFLKELSMCISLLSLGLALCELIGEFDNRRAVSFCNHFEMKLNIMMIM